MITQDRYVHLLHNTNAYYDFVMRLQDAVWRLLCNKNIPELLMEKGAKGKRTIYRDEANDLVQDVLANYADVLFNTPDNRLSLAKVLDLICDLKVERISNCDENKYAPIAYLSFQEEYGENSSKLDGFDEEQEKASHYQEVMDDNFYYKRETLPKEEPDVALEDIDYDEKQAALKQLTEQIACGNVYSDEEAASESEKMQQNRLPILKGYWLAVCQWVRSYIAQLPPKRQERFMALYVYVKYRQDFELQKKPSERKENALGEKPATFKNRKLVSRCKQDQLANHYHLVGFWDEMVGPLFVEKLAYNGFDALNKWFEKYRPSLTRNVTRVWGSERDALLEALQNEGTFNIPITPQEHSKIITCLTDELNVHPLPGPDTVLKRPKYEKNLYLHARFTESLNITCCRDYLKPLTLFVREQLLPGIMQEGDKSLQSYKEHRKNCSACRAYEIVLKRDLLNRVSRMEENRQKYMRYFYPDHRLENNNFPLEDTSAAIQYYEKVYADKPSDLYEVYLKILSIRQGTTFNPSVESRNKQKKRGSKLGYALETHCKCGAINHYRLNALRFPRVIIGSNQEGDISAPYINLCGDDNCYFKYDTTKGDWVFGAGAGHIQDSANQKEREDITKYITYITSRDLFSKLDDIKIAGNDKIKCQETLSKCWQKIFPGEQIALSQIALIRVAEREDVKSHNKKNHGIYHPILGLLENTTWLLEVNANRSDESIMVSMVQESLRVEDRDRM